jgi:hypothetical protein
MNVAQTSSSHHLIRNRTPANLEGVVKAKKLLQ